MLARLASRKAKPAGSYHILPPDVASFLAPLVIDDLHGFGYSARQKAKEKLGTVNLGELVKKAKSVLCEVMGKATGEMLYNAVRGIDERKLESDKPRKSVSCDINVGFSLPCEFSGTDLLLFLSPLVILNSMVSGSRTTNKQKRSYINLLQKLLRD